MKIDIVNVFGTSFVQADERHPDVQSFHQSVGEKTLFPITLDPIDSHIYLEHIVRVLENSKAKVDTILGKSPTVSQVAFLRDYYLKENQGIPAGFGPSHEKIDGQIDDMVDALIQKYSQNILINQASKPIALVRKIKSKFFLVVTGNFCAENGKGEFTLKEFLINDIKKSLEDQSMDMSVETMDLTLQRIVRGQGIGKYEAMIRAYENETPAY